MAEFEGFQIPRASQPLNFMWGAIPGLFEEFSNNAESSNYTSDAQQIDRLIFPLLLHFLYI